MIVSKSSSLKDRLSDVRKQKITRRRSNGAEDRVPNDYMHEKIVCQMLVTNVHKIVDISGRRSYIERWHANVRIQSVFQEGDTAILNVSPARRFV